VGVGEDARGVGEAEEVPGPPDEDAGGGCARGGVGARGGLEERGRGRRSLRGDGAVRDQDGRRRHSRRPELLVRPTQRVLVMGCQLENRNDGLGLRSSECPFTILYGPRKKFTILYGPCHAIPIHQP
jgi:hypothetical protein